MWYRQEEWRQSSQSSSKSSKSLPSPPSPPPPPQGTYCVAFSTIFSHRQQKKLIRGERTNSCKRQFFYPRFLKQACFSFDFVPFPLLLLNVFYCCWIFSPWKYRSVLKPKGERTQKKGAKGMLVYDSKIFTRGRTEESRRFTRVWRADDWKDGVNLLAWHSAPNSLSLCIWS